VWVLTIGLFFGGFISALVGGSLANVLKPQLNLTMGGSSSVIVYVPLTERLVDKTRDEHVGLR